MILRLYFSEHFPGNNVMQHRNFLVSGTPLFSCGTRWFRRNRVNIHNFVEGPSSIIVFRIYRYKSGQHYKRLEIFAKALSMKGLAGKATAHPQSHG